MKRVEKAEEGAAEKQGNLGEKLKRGVLVRKGGEHATPVSPPWTLLGLSADGLNKVPPTVSARKLAATLWELYHYRLPLSKMHHQHYPGTRRSPTRRRCHHHHLYKDRGRDIPSTANILPDPPPSFADLPGSARSFKRHVAASLMQHHRSIERSNHAIQPVSPASYGTYGSSMELAPYHPAVTPSSSVDFKGRIGEAGYSLKTSTELLNVLNRIWSLEEQHASNVSLVKALKKDLDHAHARIKELVRDQQADRHEIDDLMKQIAEDKLLRKSKEQDRISAAIQSARDELEVERKLRKQSESLHRKLARELYDVKLSLANALKDLEREGESRKLLEDLCDEFARGIRNFEQELHALNQRSDEDWTERDDHHRLILHLSETWLDERVQKKLGEAQYGLGQKNCKFDKLSSEIETFLQAKRSINPKCNDNQMTRNSNFHRNSVESIPLNVVASAPQDVGDEEDSVSSDSLCFEINKQSSGEPKQYGEEAEETHVGDTVRPNQMKERIASHGTINRRNPIGLQVKFEEQMARATSCNECKTEVVGIEKRKTGEQNLVETSISKKSEICEATEEDNCKSNNKNDITHQFGTENVINNLIRSQRLLPEAVNMHRQNDNKAAPCGTSAWRSNASPVRQWTARLPCQDISISESCSKAPLELKEDTLKAKLLEAKTRGQHSRSRLKASKIPLRFT